MRAVMILTLVLVVLSGCMGTDRKYTILLVEPGSVVEVADDEKVTVQAHYKDDAGKDQVAIEKRSIAGTVAMPKSVYRKLRTTYVIVADYASGKISEDEMKKRLKESGRGEADQADKAAQ